MTCKATKKNGEACEQNEEYGVLCPRHARQIANTPSGFQSRRVERNHLKNVNDIEMLDAVISYREEKGEDMIRTSSALSYRLDVIEMLVLGEKSAGEIVGRLNEVSHYAMSSSKVGQLMRTMMNEGTVVRRQANVGGVWGSIYALKEAKHEQDPLHD